MTIEEIKTKYSKRSDGYIYCVDCPIDGYENYCPCLMENINETCEGTEVAWNAIKKFFDDHTLTTEDEVVDSSVDHPSHYNQSTMETIVEMELIFGIDAVMDFCKLNAWKYRARAAYKGNPEEDMAKADWYLAKYKELYNRDCGE